MNLKIELGDFYEDYRKETLLFVDIEEKPLVCDVIKYICEVCEIKSTRSLNGPETILRPQEEARLVQYVKGMCAIGHGISIEELRITVKKLLDAESDEPRSLTNFTDNKPSRAWVQGFRRRFKDVLTVRTPEHLGIQRAYVKEKNLRQGFKDLEAFLLEEHQIVAEDLSQKILCLFANGIYIPEKQPSLVLKEVKNVLSLRRQLNVKETSHVSNNQNSILLPQPGKKVDDTNENVQKCKPAVDPFSLNNIGASNMSIPITEISYDSTRRAELFSVDEISHSSLPKKKKKKDKRNKFDNPAMLQDNEKINSSNICLESSYVEDDINNYMKDISEVVSPNKKDLALSDWDKISINSKDLPTHLDVSNTFKSSSKRKKSRNKERNDSEVPFESFESNVISSSIDNVCNYNETENIGSTEEKEFLLTPSMLTSISSFVDKPKLNKDHCKESQIFIENNEFIKEKFQGTDSLKESEDHDKSLLSLDSFPNPQKKKRKRKHNKKSHCSPSNEFSTHINQAIKKDKLEQKCKMFKFMDDSDKKNNHIKFGSDEEQGRLEDETNIATATCPPLYITEAISNRQSPTFSTSLLCSKKSVTSSSPLVKVPSVTPLAFQNCGKIPPSPLQYIDRCVDSIIFTHLLKLENSQEVCIFKRKNLKPSLNSKNSKSNNSLKSESTHVNNVPHSPPSPVMFSSKINKVVNPQLNLCEELEKSTYPQIYFRKQKAAATSVNNGVVALNREVAKKLIVQDESNLGLPFSFTSGASKGQRKGLPLLNSYCTISNEELINDRIINGLSLNDSNTIGNEISFTGAKPKKLKEKKIYSPLGVFLKSLKNTKQNVITTDENKSSTINNLNLNHKEIASVLVEELEPTFKDIPEHKDCNNEQVIIGEECDNQEHSNNLVDDTASASRTLKSERSILNSQESHDIETHPIVDLSLPVDIAKTKENINLNYFYKSCPILPTLPNEGDIIAAKVMTLDETYSPCFSDYRTAKVNSISGLTLSLLFLDEGEFTPDEIRKDNVTSFGNKGKISKIDWRDLNDVRLLFP